MKYNFIEQRPDYYNVREYDSADIESLKEQIKDNYPSQLEQFESVNYNPYDYMYKRLYHDITDEDERWNVICLLLEYSPLRRIYKSYNSVLTDMDALNLRSIKDEKKLCYLFFCESEEDFWDYFTKGYGSIKLINDYYEDWKGVEKARCFLLHLYHHASRLPQKTMILNLLKSEYDFDEMNDAINAWDTGVLELRQELVNTQERIMILKKILEKRLP